MSRFVWVPFAAALAGFVLPFATVSCGDVEVEPTGAELVLRTAPEQRCAGPDGTCPEQTAYDVEFELGEVVVAFAGGLAAAAFLGFGFALVLARVERRRGWTTLAGAVGVGALVALGTRDYGPTGAAGPDALAVATEARAGFWLVLAGGMFGTIAAGFEWLRAGRPSVRPFLPVLGAGLLLVSYLLPWKPSAEMSTAYADSLDLRHPWLAVFGLLTVAAGLALAARRHDLTPALASLGLGVLIPAAVATVQSIWHDWRFEVIRPGLPQFLLLAGSVSMTVFAARNLRLVERRDEVRGAFALPGAAVLAAAAFSSSVDESDAAFGVVGSDDVAWHVLAAGVAAAVAALAGRRLRLHRRAFVAGLGAAAAATGLYGLAPLTVDFGGEVGWGVWATLAGSVLLLASCVPRRGRAGRPAAVRERSAPAPSAPPRARSAPESGGSPPAAP